MHSTLWCINMQFSAWQDMHHSAQWQCQHGWHEKGSFAAPSAHMQRLTMGWSAPRTLLHAKPWFLHTQARLQARVQQRARRAQAVADGVRQLEARAVRRPVQVDARLRQVLVQHLRINAPMSACPRCPQPWPNKYGAASAEALLSWVCSAHHAPQVLYAQPGKALLKKEREGTRKGRHRA